MVRCALELQWLWEACRLRMEEAGEEERGRLESVEKKLAVAMRLEDKSRERRAKQQKSK